MSQINAAMVKSLRDRTGAGMMDCKKALMEVAGDEEKAVEIIQKKGLAKVAKRAGAVAAEGLIQSYIHSGGRIGVLMEVNCQTDFVARNADFVAFTELLGMQVAAMGAQYVRRDEIPESDVARQRALFLGQLEEEEAKTGKPKPEVARGKIVEGKLNKWMSESCLVEQPSVQSEDGETIQQQADALSAKLGEKVHIRRFIRFELGEGITVEKKDFAAEVAETMAN